MSDDYEIIRKLTQSSENIKINDTFYDMLEEEYGYEVSVHIEGETTSFLFLRVGHKSYAYHKESHTWEELR